MGQTTAVPEPAMMRRAIALGYQAGLEQRSGGPFGAVVVYQGRIVGEGCNRVLADRDPTAHAEVVAIRNACRTLGRHDLRGAVLYSSSQCCPLCYSAAFWARLDRIWYGARWQDYSDLFDDQRLHDSFSQPPPQRSLPMQELLREEALTLWEAFRRLPDGARY